jgi:hypothetical protein
VTWRYVMAMLALIGAPVAAIADTIIGLSPAHPRPGIYSNEEQVYFAKEMDGLVPPLVFLQVDDKQKQTVVDAFGQASSLHNEGVAIIAASDTGLTGRLADGSMLILRRARSATCWVAIKKDKPKPDGKEDWLFVRDIKLHDQGGRATVGGGDSGAKPLVVRMRNVIWPLKKDGTPATNKPSIVLYVHKPDQPDRAESYVWADPGAARIGINLRWMQASCGIDGAEPASKVSSQTLNK